MIPCDDLEDNLTAVLEDHCSTVVFQDYINILSTGFLLFTPKEWKDERLTWNPADYQGVTSLVLPPALVWLPEFVLDNS